MLSPLNNLTFKTTEHHFQHVLLIEYSYAPKTQGEGICGRSVSHSVIRACEKGVNIDSGTFGKMQSAIYTSAHSLSTAHEDGSLVREEILVPQGQGSKTWRHMGLGFEVDL